MDDSSITQCLILFALILLRGVMAATETACMNANRIRLKTLAEEENSKPAARAAKLLEKFDDDLIALLIGQNVISIASTAVATTLFISLVKDEALGSILSTVIMTSFIYLIGETIPKNIANANADKVLMLVAVPLDVFSKLLTPIIWVFSTVSALLRKKLSGDKKEPSMTEEEFQTVVESISDDEILEPSEKRIIKSAVDFGDKTVAEVMRPREEIFAIEKTTPPGKVKELLIDVPFSRIPVYEKSLDNIVGIIRSKQILESLINGNKRISEVKLFPVLRTEPGVKLNVLFEEMGKKRTHMAIVRENKQVIGIVTLEDLLEEIVGEIYDDDEDIDQKVLEEQIEKEDLPETAEVEEEEVSA